MTTITEARLTELEEIARKATPGPWQEKHDPSMAPKNWPLEIIGNIDGDADDEGRLVLTYEDVCVVADTNRELENEAYLIAFDPPTALALISPAREGLAGRVEIERITADYNDMREAANKAEATSRDHYMESVGQQQRADVAEAALSTAHALVAELEDDAAELRMQMAQTEHVNNIQRKRIGVLEAALLGVTDHLVGVLGGPMIAGKGVVFTNGVEQIPTIAAARAGHKPAGGVS